MPSCSSPTAPGIAWPGPTSAGPTSAGPTSAGTRDITPVADATYGDVAYHPSGLAIGFAASTPDGPQLWMSTNQGQDPKSLIAAPAGTTFGHLVFAHDGRDLYYSVDRKGGSHALANYNLVEGGVAPTLWTGDAPVDDIVELGGVPGSVALTAGAGCEAHRALFSTLDGSADRFVVAVGGCGRPSDLSIRPRRPRWRSSGPVLSWCSTAFVRTHCH